MANIPKKRAAVVQMVDQARKYSVEEACALVKKAKFAKFDETVDLAVRLGVNPKHADQMVRGAIVLPHGTGKKPGAGSKEPNKVKVGKVTMKQVRELAQQKIGDMNCTDIESAIQTVMGTARSMGIDVVEA